MIGSWRSTWGYAAVLLAVVAPAMACAPTQTPEPVTPEARMRAEIERLRNRQYLEYRSPVACDEGSGGQVSCRNQLGVWTPDHCAMNPDVPRCYDWLRRSDEIAARARAAAEDAGTIGQGVFALTRDGRFDAAADLAGACAAERWWCAMLDGHVLYERGDLLAAEVVLDSAVRLMPEPEACAWSELEWVVEKRAIEPYEAEECVERWRRLEAVWSLADPAWSRPGNEARAEWLGRMAWTELHDDQQEERQEGGGFVTDGVGHSRDHHRETMRGDPHRLNIGHAWRRPRAGPPTLSILSAADAIADPRRLEADDWRFVGERDDFRIRTPFGGLEAIPSQVAFFERGDSILVVALTEPPRGPFSTLGPVESVHLVVASVDGRRVASVTGDVAGPGRPLTVVVPNDVWLVGIETGTPRGVGRARFAHRLPSDPASRIRASDLLLFRASAADPAMNDLGDVLPQARGASDWEQGDVVGVYMELYGPREASSIAVEVTLESLDRPGLLRRIGEAAGLLEGDAPLRIAWSEPTGDDGFSGVWTLDLSDTSPGRYRLRLRVGGGEEAVDVTRELEVRAAGRSR